MTVPSRLGHARATVRTLFAAAATASAVFLVARVRPRALAVAASRPPTTGKGSGTFIRPHSSAMAASTAMM
jgi:hypothetical protein